MKPYENVNKKHPGDKKVRENEEVKKIKDKEQIINMIKNEAQEVEVPESLMPDRILNMLENAADDDTVQSGVGKKYTDYNRKKRNYFYYSYAACAAVLLLVCGFILFRAPKDVIWTAESETPTKTQEMDKVDNKDVVSEKVSTDNDVEEPVIVIEKKKDAGDLYQVANDYEKVYDMIMQNGMYLWDGCVAEPEATIAGVPSSRQEENVIKVEAAVQEKAAVEDFVYNDMIEYASAEKQLSHSTTNLQLQGVDESDIVKTDGICLYIVKEDRIYIVDAKDGKLSQSTVVSIPFSGNGTILELYVDQGLMVAVVQETSSALREAEGDYVDADGKVTTSKQYITTTKTTTSLYTYSLKDPMKPVLLGSVSQDGNYHTSRKIGDQVYLFTDQWMAEECYYSDKDSYSWVPLAGGEPIAADCIYLPKAGASSLLISSVNLKQPEEIYDTVMIVNDNATVYMSTDAIYLYHTDYTQERGGSWITEIAKFTLENGQINASAATNVNGSVTDTFAVNASDGMLRILTTDFNGNGSDLYILDENLTVKGKLTGLAPGEDIYSARYFKEMVYFVTYRNMDPLFAVDLSDPSDPKLLGELKITGYSDYLHMWGEDKLLGIGYETDPDNGRRKGLKLSMFDVSDPVNLQAVDTVILKNMDYTPALDQYKTVLADPSCNLIGFAATDYDAEWENMYLLFRWEEGQFTDVFSKEIGENADRIRGMYVGDYYYIVTGNQIISFDMQNEFTEVATFSLSR